MKTIDARFTIIHNRRTYEVRTSMEVHQQKQLWSIRHEAGGTVGFITKWIMRNEQMQLHTIAEQLVRTLESQLLDKKNRRKK